MKYVDWIKDEYCHGDYNMIEAFLVAFNFNDSLINQKESIAFRKFTVGRRPAKSFEWTKLRLISYQFDNREKRIIFNPIDV